MSTAFLSLQQDIESIMKANNLYLSDFVPLLQSHSLDNLESLLIEDLTQVSYDSYGHEDTYLGLVFEFPEYDNILVLFEGGRSSYIGEEWRSYKEVQKQTKTISYYG